MPDIDMTAVEQKACEEALKRIGDCGRRRGAMLDLGGLGLTCLPPEIGQLAKLTELHLSHNRLVSLPPEIHQLTHLTRLDLSHNMLEFLSPEIGQLAALAQLDLTHNRLGTLPPDIGQLANLTRLDISNNKLDVLPPEFGRLAHLTRLYLSHNRLAAVPPELGQLASLTRLYLSNNLLAAVPPEIGRLANLTRLYLSGNLLAAVPPELGQLAKLTVLDLSHNLLDTLPPEFGQLAKLTVLSLMANRLTVMPDSLRDLENLVSLLLHDNPALQLMPSVLGSDPRIMQVAHPATPKSILDFYFARLTGKTRPLNEARLILLGGSGAGKTSVVQALRDLPFHEREVSTTGVALCDWTLDACHGPPVTVHVWDFSGHEITHALHPFFFSSRSLYVVVLAGRDHRERDDAEYWLRLIQTHASDEHGQGPPVIVALNQWNVPGCRPDVDRTALRDRYPFIRGFVEMDCKAKKGVPALRTALGREVDRMPWAREPFPEEWNAVRRALTATGTPCALLTQDAYRALCAEHGVQNEGQQDYLAEILHHLGTALNYRNDPRLHEAAVLQPVWLTKNLYALLLRAEKLAGVLGLADVEAVLHAEKDDAARAWLMYLMERCGIACTLPDAPGGGAWLVPRALPAAAPAGSAEFRDAPDAIRVRYVYQNFPGELVARFIVRRHAFVEVLREQKQQWCGGVIFSRKGARALIHAIPQDRQLLLTVTGPRKAREQFAELCRQEMRDIHAEIPHLDPVEEMVY
jgi:internalin A